MSQPKPWAFQCDGKDCTRSIGDIGHFLWHHPNANLDYCPECWDAVKHLWPNEVVVK